MSDPAIIQVLQESYAKGTLQVTSNHCSGYALPNLRTTHAPESIAKLFTENIGDIASSMRTHVLSPYKTEVFDPDNLSSLEDLSFLRSVGKMINVEIAMPYDQTLRNHFVASLNSPGINFLNANLRGDVVLLGVDTKESDLVRINKAAAFNHVSPTVFCVDKRFETGGRIVGHYGNLANTYVFKGVQELLSFIRGSCECGSNITTVVMNHTFTAFCSGDRALFKEFLISLRELTSTKVDLFGTYMDPASIIVERAAGVIAEEAMIEYLGIHEVEGKHYHKIKVLDTIYYDCIFNTSDLYELFREAGWHLDIMHSSRYIAKCGKIKKVVKKNLSTIQCLRVALAYSLKPEKRGNSICGFVPSSSDNGPFEGARIFNMSHGVFPSDIPIQVVPETSLPSFPVRKNKGVPLNGKDIACLGDSYWWGPKHQGFHCQMLLSGDKLSVSSGLGSFIVNIKGHVKVGCYLEGELIVYPEYYERPLLASHPDFRKQLSHIVVFDGLPLSMTVEDPFVSRWVGIEGTLFLYQDLLPFFTLQTWASADLVSDYTFMSIMKSDAYPEGVVIQPMFSPPGKFRNGFGSARYIKKHYTYEVRDVTRGVIIEIDLKTKKYMRDRPDRTLPSTLEDVLRIESAVSVMELHLFAMLMFKYYNLQTFITPDRKAPGVRYFISNAQEYLTCVAKSVLTDNFMSTKHQAAFVELLTYPGTCEQFLKQLCNWDNNLTVMKEDKMLLERANRVLKASDNTGSIVDATAFATDYGEEKPSLQEVAFHYVMEWVLDCHLVGSNYGWYALVCTRPDDNVFSMIRKGDDVQQASIYLFRSTPVTMDVVNVPFNKITRHGMLKKHKIIKDLGSKNYDKTNVEYIMPNVVVTGLELSDVEGDTLEERLDSAEALLMRHKAAPRRVSVRFLLRREVFMSAKDVFPRLEQAILAAQLQYTGVISIGV